LPSPASNPSKGKADLKSGQPKLNFHEATKPRQISHSPLCTTRFCKTPRRRLATPQFQSSQGCSQEQIDIARTDERPQPKLQVALKKKFFLRIFSHTHEHHLQGARTRTGSGAKTTRTAGRAVSRAKARARGDMPCMRTVSALRLLQPPANTMRRPCRPHRRQFLATTPNIVQTQTRRLGRRLSSAPSSSWHPPHRCTETTPSIARTQTRRSSSFVSKGTGKTWQGGGKRGRLRRRRRRRPSLGWACRMSDVTLLWECNG